MSLRVSIGTHKMNSIREIEKINQQELDRGIAGTSASWHSKYANYAWVYVGNLAHELTEGDILCVLSQYGELEDIHLIRDAETGKSKGFCFAKYEDSRSCVLAVDNLIGFKVGKHKRSVLVLVSHFHKLCGRSLRIDHVENYRVPKKKDEDETEHDGNGPGHAYEGQELENEFSILQGQDLFAGPEEKNRAEKKRVKEEKKRAKEERKRERDRIRRDREERRRAKRSKRERERSPSR